jgi:hypothetical protein
VRRDDLKPKGVLIQSIKTMVPEGKYNLVFKREWSDSGRLIRLTQNNEMYQRNLTCTSIIY